MELILRADRALYQAKAAGKNCVRVHTPAGPGKPVPPFGLTRSTPDVER